MNCKRTLLYITKVCFGSNRHDMGQTWGRSYSDLSSSLGLWYDVNIYLVTSGIQNSVMNSQRQIKSLFASTLHHRIFLTGVLEASGRPCHGPAERAGHLSQDVPLEKLKHRVPPGVSEVVVRRTF